MECKSIVNTVPYGKFVVRLNEILIQKGISKTKLAELAHTNYQNIKRLCDKNVYRIDLDIIARICYVLDCELTDIVKYEADPGGETK